MEQAGDKIRTARLARGFSQVELAKRVGISQPALRKIEGGITRHSKFLPRIAEVLELNLRELDPTLRQSVKSPSVRASEREHMGATMDFPIHASVEGERGELVVSDVPADFAVRPVPLAHVPRAYGLLIVGKTMEPEYRAGDLALINPHLPIVGGEAYVFYAEREGSGRATVKHLRRYTADNWLVTMWNPPAGLSRDFPLPRKEWQWAHRILGKYSRT